MADKPDVRCPKCSGPARKIPSACSFSVHGSSSIRSRIEDGAKKERDMRSELSRDYGVEKIAPLAGQRISDVYRDVKSRGDFVREEMKKSEEDRTKKALEKRREWTKKASKRATRKRLEADRRKAAEDYSKRKIVI